MRLGKETVQHLVNNSTAGYSLRMDTMPAVLSSDDEVLLTKFAVALLKHPQDANGRFAAALSVTANTTKALIMANQWPDRPDLIAIQEKLIEQADEGELDLIGTKAEFARELLDQARTMFNPQARAKMYELYAKVRNFLPKEGSNVNVQVNQNKVMIVKDFGSDENWEKTAAAQQRALLNVSASRH